MLFFFWWWWWWLCVTSVRYLLPRRCRSTISRVSWIALCDIMEMCNIWCFGIIQAYSTKRRNNNKTIQNEQQSNSSSWEKKSHWIKKESKRIYEKNYNKCLRFWSVTKWTNCEFNLVKEGIVFILNRKNLCKMSVKTGKSQSKWMQRQTTNTRRHATHHTFR